MSQEEHRLHKVNWEAVRARLRPAEPVTHAAATAGLIAGTALAVAHPGALLQRGAAKPTSRPAPPSQAGPQAVTSGLRTRGKSTVGQSYVDMGPTSPNERIGINLYLQLRNPAQARDLAQAVSDPSSPQYGHYLSAADFGARFAPRPQTIKALEKYLQSYGIKTKAGPASWHFIQAAGTVRQFNRAFDTRLHDFGTHDGPEMWVAFHAPIRKPKLPARFDHAVLAIEGLDSRYVAHNMLAWQPPDAYRDAGPVSAYWGQNPASSLPTYNGQTVPYATQGYTPAQLRSAYGLDQLLTQGIDGKGEVIAIVDAYASPTIRSDANEYALHNGEPQLAPGQFRELLMKKNLRDAPPTAGCGPQGWAMEESLDVEAAHATAPGANILYVGARDCSDQQLQAAIARILDHNLASIITNSWGQLETSPQMEKSWDALFEQAAIEGITVDFSSGDSGDNTATLFGDGTTSVNTPASSPWVTAVGGTSLGVGDQGQYLFETGWGTAVENLNPDGTWDGSPFFIYGGGGGASSFIPQPYYQQGIVPAALAKNGGAVPYRTLPDISMDADPTTGFEIGMTMRAPDGEIGYGQFRIGGTSLASPLMAGVEALANQAAGHRLGFINPRLYTLPAGAVRDVVPPPAPLAAVVSAYDNGYSGSVSYQLALLNQDTSLQTLVGYDTATGLGSPNGAAFVHELAGN